MRRFDENVARIGDGKEISVTQAAHEIRCDVVIGSSDETQPDLRIVKFPLQLVNRDSDLGSGIIIESGQNVRCAAYALHALRHVGARHVERDRQLFRPVIHARQNMTMQIDHISDSTRV